MFSPKAIVFFSLLLLFCVNEVRSDDDKGGACSQYWRGPVGCKVDKASSAANMARTISDFLNNVMMAAVANQIGSITSEKNMIELIAKSPQTFTAYLDPKNPLKTYIDKMEDKI